MLTDRTQPEAIVFRHVLCESAYCSEFALEAWERMTYGGVVVRQCYFILGEMWYPKWLPPYILDAKDGYTEYVSS